MCFAGSKQSAPAPAAAAPVQAPPSVTPPKEGAAPAVDSRAAATTTGQMGAPSALGQPKTLLGG